MIKNGNWWNRYIFAYFVGFLNFGDFFCEKCLQWLQVAKDFNWRPHLQLCWSEAYVHYLWPLFQNMEKNVIFLTKSDQLDTELIYRAPSTELRSAT